jgi:hypothetical protein
MVTFQMLLSSLHAPPESTVLMFSGGRDSTVGCLRLHKMGNSITLVTITSTHLEGIERVKARLRELAKVLPEDTQWIHIEQPEELLTDTSFYDQTCLPCHHAYVVVSAIIARSVNAHRIAFGYTSYQGDWPEQTPLAISRLAFTLKKYGIDLVLPVYDIDSRDDVIAELLDNGFSCESLEQKCLRQVTNIALSEDRLSEQVALWESAIDKSMNQMHQIPINVLEHCKLGDLSNE